MIFDKLVATFSGCTEGEVKQAREGLRHVGDIFFQVSLVPDGVYVDGYQFYISWRDVVSIVLEDENWCHITIRGGVAIRAEISSGDINDYTEFIGEVKGCDNSNFDVADLSAENLKKLSAQIDDIEFSEKIANDLRSIKAFGLNEPVFLDNLNVVSRNLWSTLCNLRGSSGRGVIKWADFFSESVVALIRNIKTQIAQCDAAICLLKKFGIEQSDYCIAQVGLGLWYVATMSDEGYFVNVESQKKSYEGYFGARYYGVGSSSEALSALVARGDGARPFGAGEWRRERKMIVCPALTDATRPDATIAAEGIKVNGVMLMSAEDIENYNESEVGNQLPLVFDVGHPQNGKTYLQHPLQQNRYVDVDDYDFVMLNSKWLELQKLLEHLGAAKMTSKVSSAKMVEEKTRKKQDIGGRVNITAVGGVSCKTSHERSDSALADLFQEMSGTIELHPRGEPSIPDGLVFFKAEPGWQQMAESVLAGRMTHACVDLVYKTETVVSSKQMRSIEAELSSAVPGYQFGIGGSFADEFEKERRERKTLIWHYEVTFAEKTQRSDAKINKEGKGKLLSPKPTQKRMAVKPESSGNGEAMILGRAKRYAKTKDAAKSGMLTDAQKADLEKLASKYGVGELRLEELIDEAFM